MKQHLRRGAGALALCLSGAAAGLVASCGDDVAAVCDVYCKCAGCTADVCKTELASARAAATSQGCGVELDAYLVCTKAQLACSAPFANAGACKAQVEAALACGVTRGLGQDCEGTGRFVDALVAGCDGLSQSGTYAPSTCEPVPTAVVSCRLACAQQYECSNALDACLEGCAVVP